MVDGRRKALDGVPCLVEIQEAGISAETTRGLLQRWSAISSAVVRNLEGSAFGRAVRARRLFRRRKEHGGPRSCPAPVYEFKEEADTGDTRIGIYVAPIDRKMRSQTSKREEK